MTDDAFQCRDPNGVPFAETNNYVDRRWAMKTIAVKDAFIAELEARIEELGEISDAFIMDGESAVARIVELENLTRRLNQECNAEFVRNKKLEAENKALRAALKPFADRYGEITKMFGGVTQDYAVLTVDVGFGDLCTAHAALKGEKAS